MTLIKTLLLTTILALSLSAREQVNVNFANLEINDFIKLIGKITNKNILINNKITGSVDFVSSSPVYDDELLEILVSVLESKGYTLVENGSIYEIVRSSEAAKHNAKVVVAGRGVSGSLMITQAIKIEDENVDIVAAKVRYLISKTAKLMTMKESNTILITDYPKNIETIKKVIKDLSAQDESVVKIIPIEHTDLKQIQTHLSTIAKSIFNEKIKSQKVEIIANETMNGIIVIGVEENVQKIESYVKELDVEAQANSGVEIFHLKNSDSKSVLASLNAIISKQVYPDKTNKPNLSSSDEINAIIAVGEPSIVKGLKYIIDELDREKYQVYVKAKIVEINKQNTEELGVRYGFGGGAGRTSANGIYAMSANMGTLGDDAVGLLSTDMASGKSFALLATLNFLELQGASRTVSNPSILCINNKESSIYVGKTISVQTGSTVGTTGLPTVSYKREDVGLTLKIKPRVSSTDKVGLDVEAVLENVQTADANNNPITTKQEVKTEIILRNGEDIVIGGLVKDYNTQIVERLPVLGHIPWIGEWLFSYKKDEVVKDNLIIVLTPYILNKSEQLSELQEKLGKLDNLQNEYNNLVLQEMEKRKEKTKSE